MNDRARERIDGATHTAPTRMKMAWWWEDPWDCHHTHGFPQRTDSRWRSLSLWHFPPWGGIPPLLKFDQVERLHFDCWSVLFPCFSIDKPRPLKWAYWTLASFPLGRRTQTSGSCYPACSGGLVPSPLSVLTCEILQSASHCQSGWIVSNYAVLHSATRAGLRTTNSFSHAT